MTEVLSFNKTEAHGVLWLEQATHVFEQMPEEQATFVSWEPASFPIFIAFPDVFRNLIAFGNGITLAFPRGMNLRDDAPEIGWTSVVPVSKVASIPTQITLPLITVTYCSPTNAH